MPTPENIETIYNSLFRHGVDEKRRVQVPAKWRPGSEVELTLIVWPSEQQGPCLRVLPPKQMTKLMAQLDAMSGDDRNKAILKRLIGAKSIQVTVDKAGRICLPESAAKEAGISNEAVLVGLLDRFEIWNPERYAAVEAAHSAMASEAFRMME